MNGPIRFFEMPWPVFVPIVSPADVTEERVREFLFHPLRSSGKTRKETLNSDFLKWHPDKFSVQLPKILEAERSKVAETAEIVARILINIKTEEDNHGC
ncbi:hypothetical protein BKA93DRAFT_730099 [Sparassis latifolia]